MKKYVVAEGYAFTANGHIYSAGDECYVFVTVPSNVNNEKSFR